MTTFDNAFEIIIGHEGGFQNNPKDAGNYANGRLVGTKYGISARAYPNEDIPHLTLERAKFLYKRDYWDAVNGDNLEPSLALVVFDTAVNSGVSRALKLLNGSKTANDYLDARLRFLRSLGSYQDFGRGWETRVAKLREQAAQWAQVYPTPSLETSKSPRLIFVNGQPFNFTKASEVDGKWYINT